MTEFSHVYMMRFDSGFGSKVTNALWNSLQASCNEVVTKGGFGPGDFTTIHRLTAQPKSSSLQQQRLVLLTDEGQN